MSQRSGLRAELPVERDVSLLFRVKGFHLAAGDVVDAAVELELAGGQPRGDRGVRSHVLQLHQDVPPNQGVDSLGFVEAGASFLDDAPCGFGLL